MENNELKGLDLIKQLLGETFTEEVEKAIISYANTGGEKFVPREKYNTTKVRLDEALEQITKRDNQLSELSEKAKGHEDLEARIRQLQETNTKAVADYENKMKELSQAYAFREKLGTYKPRNLKALEALIDRSKLEFKDDGIAGLDEQIEAIKKSDGYLFDLPTTGTGVPQSGSGLETKTSDPFLDGFDSEAKK